MLESFRDYVRLVRVVALPAVMYNGLLAIISAHVMPLGFAHVALMEITLRFVSLLYLLYRGLSQEALPIFMLVGFFALVMLYTSAPMACCSWIFSATS